MMSLSFMIRSSSPSSLTSVPDHLPKSTRSPTLRSIGINLPDSSRPPGPTAAISPCEGFSLAVSGMMMPPLVFSSASIRLTTTRSCSGRNLVLAMTVPLEVLGLLLDLPPKVAGNTGVFDAAEGSTGEWSGFDIRCPATEDSRGECQIHSTGPLGIYFAGGPLIPKFAKRPASAGCRMLESDHQVLGNLVPRVPIASPGYGVGTILSSKAG